MIPDRFRWVFCQLDTLRRCMPSSICKALDELPITLDDTYERILQGIPKEKFQHARRLFQCIVAAIRPLRVEELAEIFAIEFGANEATNLVDGWRPENPEEAVHSVCSSLIAIIDDRGSKIVQFSHFSVKEFLTSDRLETSDIGHLSDYYIPLEPAHAILARACIAVFLQLDEKVDRERVATFPLGEYASEHWLDHAKFENVQSQIEDDLKYLFDPKRPHLRACIWMHNVEDRCTYDWGHSAAKQPPPLKATPLYYAVFCGFTELAKWLITTHAEEVNAKCYEDKTPLHVASQEGHVDAIHVLLDHGAHVNSQSCFNWTPLHFASYGGNLEVVQLLLEHEATLNARDVNGSSPVYVASGLGYPEVVRLLLSHGADVHFQGPLGTPLKWATENGHHNVVQLLLGHGANRESEGSRDSIAHL
jgi:Ankyrin repeats (many copies)/Ankyrin repeat